MLDKIKDSLKAAGEFSANLIDGAIEGIVSNDLVRPLVTYGRTDPFAKSTLFLVTTMGGLAVGDKLAQKDFGVVSKMNTLKDDVYNKFYNYNLPKIEETGIDIDFQELDNNRQLKITPINVKNSSKYEKYIEYNPNVRLGDQGKVKVELLEKEYPDLPAGKYNIPLDVEKYKEKYKDLTGNQLYYKRNHAVAKMVQEEPSVLNMNRQNFDINLIKTARGRKNYKKFEELDKMFNGKGILSRLGFT